MVNKKKKGKYMGEYKKKSDVLKQYKNVLVIFLKKKKKKR